MSAAEEHAERPLRAESRASLKEQFANLPRGKPVRVDMKKFPNAPQDIYAKPPSGAEIAAWEQGGIEYGRKGRATVKISRTRKAELIVACICDADGKLVWIPADTKTVAAMDAGIVNHLFNAARKASGQDDDDDDDKDEEPEQGN